MAILKCCNWCVQQGALLEVPPPKISLNYMLEYINQASAKCFIWGL
jgi:hypothetical protein